MSLELVTDEEQIVVGFGKDSNGKAVAVKVRRYTSAKYNNIVKQHTTSKGINRQTGQPRKITDDDAVNDDLLCFIVIELINVGDGKGGIAETTRESILSLPGSAKVKIIGVADQDNTQGDDIEDEKKTLKDTPST